MDRRSGRKAPLVALFVVLLYGLQGLFWQTPPSIGTPSRAISAPSRPHNTATLQSPPTQQKPPLVARVVADRQVEFLPTLTKPSAFTSSPRLTFKILQLADLHYSGNPTFPCRDAPREFGAGRCTEALMKPFMDELLDVEKPDLVVFSGDNVQVSEVKYRQAAVDAFTERVEARKIPYAVILGNHDDENGFPRDEVLRLVMEKNYSYTERGPLTIDGVGNYRLSVQAPVDGPWGNATDNVFHMYFLDSGSHPNKTRHPEVVSTLYDWIHPSQVEYYMNLSREAQEESGTLRPLPAVMFFHIPLQEHAQGALEYWWRTGEMNEKVSSSSVPSTLFSTLVQRGEVKATFSGHDHINAYCYRRRGLQLCYAGGTGFGQAYGDKDFLRRARVIEWTVNSANERTITSWKRLYGRLDKRFGEEVLFTESKTVKEGRSVEEDTSSCLPSRLETQQGTSPTTDTDAVPPPPLGQGRGRWRQETRPPRSSEKLTERFQNGKGDDRSNGQRDGAFYLPVLQIVISDKKRNVAAMVFSGLKCAFYIPDCPHDSDQLFSRTFARSNRTRAAKVLRCFPHCCLGHRDRSYCGAPLSLTISVADGKRMDSGEHSNNLVDSTNTTATSELAGKLNDIVVYGRFEREEHEATSTHSELAHRLVLGQLVSPAIITSRKQADPWIQAPMGTPTVPQSADESNERQYRFQQDTDELWTYNWNSGTSQRQRSRPHVFCAYAFLPVTTPLASAASSKAKKKPEQGTVLWKVVGLVSSPPFLVSVYRKRPAAQASDHALDEPYANPQNRPPEDQGEDEGQRDADNQEEAPAIVLPSEEIVKVLWEKRNPKVVTATTDLAILGMFLSHIQPAWLKPMTIFRSLLPLLRVWRKDSTLLDLDCGASGIWHHDDASNNHERLVLHFVNFCAPRIVEAMIPTSTETQFDLKPPTDSSVDDEESKSEAELATLSGLTELSWHVLCKSLEYEHWRDFESFLRDHRPLQQSSGKLPASGEVYAQFVTLLVDHIDRGLAYHTTTLSQLADDILSSMFVDRNKASNDHKHWFEASVHAQTDMILRNTRALGISRFEEQLRLIAAWTTDQNRVSLPSPMLLASDLNGRWICRSAVTESGPGDKTRSVHSTQSSFSTVLVLFTLLHVFGFDVTVFEAQHERSFETWRIQSLVSLFPELGSEFILDGSFHPLDVLPSGLSLQWLMRELTSSTTCTEYRGTVSSKSSSRPSPDFGNGNNEIVLDVYQYSSTGIGVWLRMVVAMLPPCHQQSQSLKCRRARSASSLATKTRLQVRVTLAAGVAARYNTDFEFTSAQVSSQQRNERICAWDEQFSCTLTYDHVDATTTAHANEDPDEELSAIV